MSIAYPKIEPNYAASLAVFPIYKRGGLGMDGSHERSEIVRVPKGSTDKVVVVREHRPSFQFP
jgi:hypothetical protein